MNLSNQIRQKRFSIKSNCSLFFTAKESNIKWNVKDVSLNGISVKKEDKMIDFDTHKILDNVKIICNSNSISLGRMVTKYENENNIGFFSIDHRIPIETDLIDFLDEKEPNPFDYELDAEKFSLKDFKKGNFTSKNLFDKCEKFDIFLKDWKKSSSYQYDNVRAEYQKNKTFFKNYKKPFLVLSSNDYLGLSRHPKVIEKSQRALKKYGFGSTGSPLVIGNTEIHEELSELSAKLVGKEKAILFSSGYNTNLACFQSILTRNDLAVFDFLSHTSIQDGLKLSKTTQRVFKHNSMNHLQKILSKNRENYNGCILISEGVFSMDGDTANLTKIYQISQKYNAKVFLDEAHSLGTIGKKGLGLCNLYNLNQEVDIIMGTFSKSFGSLGGFIATNEKVYNWIKYMGNAYLFSTALPPSNAASALEAIKVFLEEPEIVAKLQENVKLFVNGLFDLNLIENKEHKSPIIPIIVGEKDRLAKINHFFLENNLLVTPIIYPVVSTKTSRFRFALSSELSKDDIEYTLNIIKKAMKI